MPLAFRQMRFRQKVQYADMKAIMTLIPIVGIASSLVIIYFYPIDAKMHKELLRQLKEER